MDVRHQEWTLMQIKDFGWWCVNAGSSTNRCTTLVQDFDSRGGCTCVGAGSIWEIFVPSTRFYCEPKLLKKKSLIIFFSYEACACLFLLPAAIDTDRMANPWTHHAPWSGPGNRSHIQHKSKGERSDVFHQPWLPYFRWLH